MWTSFFLAKTELRKYIMKYVYNRFKSLEKVSTLIYATGKRRKCKGIISISVNYFQRKSTLFSSVSSSGCILNCLNAEKVFFLLFLETLSSIFHMRKWSEKESENIHMIFNQYSRDLI